MQLPGHDGLGTAHDEPSYSDKNSYMDEHAPGICHAARPMDKSHRDDKARNKQKGMNLRQRRARNYNRHEDRKPRRPMCRICHKHAKGCRNNAEVEGLGHEVSRHPPNKEGAVGN